MIYDPDSKILVIISKECKESYHMIPKINDKGDPVMVTNKPRENGKPYHEERRLLDTWYEYYIEKKEEMYKFIEMFAINSNEFDYKKIIDTVIIEPPVVK